MKLSKLYGMQILSADKKIRGYILGISCADDKIDGFICCDKNEKEFYVKAENYKIKDGVLRFGSVGGAAENSYNLKLGRTAFDENGRKAGTLTDCLIVGDRIETAVISGKKYKYSALTVGDVVLIKSAEIAAKDLFIEAICGG